LEGAQPKMFLPKPSEFGLSNIANYGDRGQSVPYKNGKTFEEVDAILSYDPETGIFLWKVDAAKNVKAGREAGCVKVCRSDKAGNPVSYLYIKIGHDIPAARLAWLLHYGEWPLARLTFKDGDTLNLRIDNIVMQNSLIDKYDMSDREQRKAYMREHQKTFPKVWKNSHLKSRFGIGLSEYAAMAAAQDNKCAICDQPETQKRGGKVKALAVDHCHTTGKIRGLLCVDCNQAIGKLKVDRNILLSAIRYLDKHADDNVVPLKQGS
jgi:hypothetical protein